MSLLRTIEDSFGISEYLNLADSADAMTDAFAGARRAPASGASTGTGQQPGTDVGAPEFPLASTGGHQRLPLAGGLLAAVALIGWRRRVSLGDT